MQIAKPTKPLNTFSFANYCATGYLTQSLALQCFPPNGVKQSLCQFSNQVTVETQPTIASSQCPAHLPKSSHLSYALRTILTLLSYCALTWKNLVLATLLLTTQSLHSLCTLLSSITTLLFKWPSLSSKRFLAWSPGHFFDKSSDILAFMVECLPLSRLYTLEPQPTSLYLMDSWNPSSRTWVWGRAVFLFLCSLSKTSTLSSTPDSKSH